MELFFFFSSRRRHTRCSRDWSSDVCSSDLLGRSLSISEISFHDLWAAYADLTLLIRLKLNTGRVVDNFALSIGKTVANGAWLMPARIGQTGMGQRAHFRQAVAVSNRAPQTLLASTRNTVGERGSAAMN